MPFHGSLRHCPICSGRLRSPTCRETKALDPYGSFQLREAFLGAQHRCNLSSPWLAKNCEPWRVTRKYINCMQQATMWTCIFLWIWLDLQAHSKPRCQQTTRQWPVCSCPQQGGSHHINCSYSPSTWGAYAAKICKTHVKWESWSKFEMFFTRASFKMQWPAHLSAPNMMSNNTLQIPIVLGNMTSRYESLMSHEPTLPYNSHMSPPKTFVLKGHGWWMIGWKPTIPTDAVLEQN